MKKIIACCFLISFLSSSSVFGMKRHPDDMYYYDEEENNIDEDEQSEPGTAVSEMVGRAVGVFVEGILNANQQVEEDYQRYIERGKTGRFANNHGFPVREHFDPEFDSYKEAARMAKAEREFDPYKEAARMAREEKEFFKRLQEKARIESDRLHCLGKYKTNSKRKTSDKQKGTKNTELQNRYIEEEEGTDDGDS